MTWKKIHVQIEYSKLDFHHSSYSSFSSPGPFFSSVFFLGSSFAGSFLFCAWVPFFFCRFLSSSSPWVSFFFMFFLVRSSPLFFLGSSAGSFLFCAWIPFFFCRFLSSSSPWVSFFFVFFLFSWGLFFFFLCGSLCLLFFFNFRSSSILHIRL